MCETCIAARIRRQRRDSSSTTCCKPCSFSRTQSCTSSCPGDHEVVLEFCRVHLEDFYPYTQGWLIRLGLLLISQSLCNLTRAICKLSANLAIPLSYNLWLQPLFGLSCCLARKWLTSLSHIQYIKLQISEMKLASNMIIIYMLYYSFVAAPKPIGVRLFQSGNHAERHPHPPKIFQLSIARSGFV